MNQDNPRRRVVLLILGASLLVTLIIGVAVWSILQGRKKPSYTEIYKSPDTGEIVRTQPNTTPEVEDNRGVYLLGAYQLVEGGMTQGQYELTKDQLRIYGAERLGNRYESLTLLPQEYRSTGNKVSTKLRLGKAERFVDFVVEYSELKYVRVFITDPNGEFASFDSGRLETTNNRELYNNH